MAENNTTVDILNDLKPNSDKYKERTKKESEKNLERIITNKRYSKIRCDICKRRFAYCQILYLDRSITSGV